MTRNVSHLDAAFEVYDSICRPRGQEIVRTSNEAGHLYTLTHPECGEDITKVVKNANRRFQWIWTHDLEAELSRAEKAFTALQKEGKR
jgi:salicylate hydroxylase